MAKGAARHNRLNRVTFHAGEENRIICVELNLDIIYKELSREYKFK